MDDAAGSSARVAPADVEIGKVNELAAMYPSVAADLRAIESVRANGPA